MMSLPVWLTSPMSLVPCSFPGGLCPWGLCLEGLCRRGSLSGGSLSMGSLSKRSLSRGSLSGGSLSMGSMSRRSLSRGSLSRGGLLMVRILLECFLVGSAFGSAFPYVFVYSQKRFKSIIAMSSCFLIFYFSK